jgi:hypothetical protein
MFACRLFDYRDIRAGTAGPGKLFFGRKLGGWAAADRTLCRSADILVRLGVDAGLPADRNVRAPTDEFPGLDKGELRPLVYRGHALAVPSLSVPWRRGFIAPVTAFVGSSLYSVEWFLGQMPTGGGVLAFRDSTAGFQDHVRHRC